MKKLLLFALMITAAVALMTGGCCKGCGNKLLDTDKIPGVKDSGIPDPHAVKENEKEIEALSKEIEILAEEQRRIAADPTLSPEEKQRRIEEIQKEMMPKVERIAKIGGDILNKETEVDKDIEKWHKESGGK